MHGLQLPWGRSRQRCPVRSVRWTVPVVRQGRQLRHWRVQADRAGPRYPPQNGRPPGDLIPNGSRTAGRQRPSSNGHPRRDARAVPAQPAGRGHGCHHRTARAGLPRRAGRSPCRLRRAGGALRLGAPCPGIDRADLQRIPDGAPGSAGLHLGHRLSDPADCRPPAPVITGQASEIALCPARAERPAVPRSLPTTPARSDSIHSLVWALAGALWALPGGDSPKPGLSRGI